MVVLTRFLQEGFEKWCPQGWSCRHEVPLFSKHRARLLGFSSRADVLLEKYDATRRLWIEFEVSRADPVANHAKFVTSHLFEPQLGSDAFIAMVSAHVTPGRQNLSACMIDVMRRIGMNAFHTALLPSFSGDEIKRLNHTDINSLWQNAIDIPSEIERALVVSEPMGLADGKQIYFAGNMFEVAANVRRWNCDMSDDNIRCLWGLRTVTYFVFDPVTADFAPSKFCAYRPISQKTAGLVTNYEQLGMSIPFYTEIDKKARFFDGAQAHRHLTHRLGMKVVSVNADGQMLNHFKRWIKNQGKSIRVHPNGAQIITTPF